MVCDKRLQWLDNAGYKQNQFLSLGNDSSIGRSIVYLNDAIGLSWLLTLPRLVSRGVGDCEIEDN